MAITQIAGFAGAGLAGAAYVPQISHLVTARATPAEHSGPLRPYVRFCTRIPMRSPNFKRPT